MGGSKVRALLGGVVVVSMLALIASEVGAGPAGASREQSTKTELAKPHGVRPAAAQQRRTILQTTPLALAAELAAQQVRSTQERRDAVIQYLKAKQDAAVFAWVAGIERAKAEAAAAEAVRVQVEARQARRSPAPRVSSGAPAAATSGDYSGTMACIRAHESDSAGGYSAVNSSSGAGGAYQALPSTWAGYAGYARAQDAPPAVQDQWAREAISTSGTRPWAGSGC